MRDFQKRNPFWSISYGLEIMTISLLMNTAHSIPLLSEWRTTIDKLPAYDVTHW
jgi:hypothetical protein